MKTCDLALAAGANDAKMLNASGPLHSPYMEGMESKLAQVLNEVHIQMPSISVYSNVTGKVYTSVEEIRKLLLRQLLEPVRWEQSMSDLIAGGHSRYIEPGPGKQLKAMLRRINPSAWSTMITLEERCCERDKLYV